MCLRRREFIKPELNAEFWSLCTSAPITSWLFGDDICGQIKDLQQHNQIGVRLTQSRSRLTPTGSRPQSAPRKYQAGARDNARRGGFHGHTVSTVSRNRESFLHQRDHPPSSKEKPEETSIIQRGSQLKLNSDNKVNTNVFASISFQENDKEVPKVEKTGGRLRNFEHEWQKIRNDSKILTYIRGCPIDFDSEPLSYQETTIHMAFSSQECEIIGNEIEELLAKGAIQVSELENGDVISPIFLRYKKDERWFPKTNY